MLGGEEVGLHHGVGAEAFVVHTLKLGLATRLMLDRGGDTLVEWGELSIEANSQDAKSELGRAAN